MYAPNVDTLVHMGKPFKFYLDLNCVVIFSWEMPAVIDILEEHSAFIFQWLLDCTTLRIEALYPLQHIYNCLPVKMA
jgi:hypothetical protein